MKRVVTDRLLLLHLREGARFEVETAFCRWGILSERRLDWTDQGHNRFVTVAHEAS